MAVSYLGLGSNLGDREGNLRAAIQRLSAPPVRLLRVSPIYESEPVGETPEPVPQYLNCVVEVETDLPPPALLDHTQQVEAALGRTPTFRWGPRIIDIDILSYGCVTLESDQLTLPHPRMKGRRFVLQSLMDLGANPFPSDGVRIRTLLESPEISNQIIRPWPSKESPDA